MTPDQVQRTYLGLLLLQTLAASLIWGVNTLFLLDAGLSITEAFVANGAFTAGMVLFEVPTGVVADAAGRRISFILGSATLLVTTVAYLGLWYVEASVGWWILVSAAIGLGFTFFSGATEAWLVDALVETGYEGAIENVFGRGQTIAGIGTLFGTIGGGLLAQINLGVPYVVRSVLLLALVGAAFVWMHDIGFTPREGIPINTEVRAILRSSIDNGLRNRPIRLFVLGAPFAAGIYIWVFYAFQPYLLELFGDPSAIFLSGVAAGVFSVAQIIGGFSIRRVRRLFKTRTGLIGGEVLVGAVALVGVGFAERFPVPVGFWVAIVLLAAVAMASSLSAPMQQAYLNASIDSDERATVLSFSSLMGNAGGVAAQPALGKVADVYSFGIGYMVAGLISVIRLPFVLAIRRMDLPADQIEDDLNPPVSSDVA